MSARRFRCRGCSRISISIFPIDGKSDRGRFRSRAPRTALTGGGSAELDGGASSGDSRSSKLDGRAVLTPGRFALEEVRAPLGGGMSGGTGAVRFADKKQFEARLAGDGVPLDAVEALRELARRGRQGVVPGCRVGDSRASRPDRLTASLSGELLLRRQIPREESPTSRPRVEDGPARRARSTVRMVSGDGGRRDLPRGRADRRVLWRSLEPAGPAAIHADGAAPGYGGRYRASGTIVLPSKAEPPPRGDIRVTKAVIDLPGRPAALRTAGEARSPSDGETPDFEPFEVVGEGTALPLGRLLGLGDGHASVTFRSRDPLDPAVLGRVPSGPRADGRSAGRARGAGTDLEPAVSRAKCASRTAKYRLTSVLAARWTTSKGRIRFEGVAAATSTPARRWGRRGRRGHRHVRRSKGSRLKDFRLTLQGRHVTGALSRRTFGSFSTRTSSRAATPTGNLVRGEVVLQRGTYSRDFDVTLTDLLSKSRPAGSASREPWKEQTRLEVHVRLSQALEVRNNLARLTGTVDLLARGTVADRAHRAGRA